MKKVIKRLFCKHDWDKKILPATYGLFGGATRLTCKKCGKVDDGEAWDRLQQLNDSYKGGTDEKDT